MNLKSYDIVYFIGIGGIGMSALARWFRAQGFVVKGYDRTPSKLTEQLQKEGMEVHFEDSVEAIPEEVKLSAEKTLVIYTPAIPPAHLGKAWLLEQGYTLHKRAAILGQISRKHPSIAVAGTHGKTSTSGMIAHILHVNQANVIGLLGGVLQGYESNFIQGKGKAEEAIMVMEADEFDRSFHQLNPDFAIITSTDADHLDIYENANALVEAYLTFAHKVPKDGDVILHQSVYDILGKDIKDRKIHTYGIESGDYQAKNIRINANGQFVFDLISKRRHIKGITMQMPGIHNIENAVAAFAVLDCYGMPAEDFKRGVENYRGVKRRFEVHLHSPSCVYIDDYAHHPSEITALLRSVRMMFPKRKIRAIFQPHLYSRTRDFAHGFITSLALADEVWLLPIYPAREEPIPGINSEMLITGELDKAMLLQKDQVLDALASDRSDVLLTVGAGDIDRLVQPIFEQLRKELAHAH
jgi:UDP-N-acetylmuramate--alanine ligase